MFRDIKLEYLDFSYKNFNIYSASSLDEESKYIVKTTKDLDSNYEAEVLLENEYNILKDLSHENLLKPIKSNKNGNRFYIYYEYFDGFSLKHFFNDLNKNKLEKFLSIVLKILDTLNYLHKNSIVHNSLNLDSILVSKDLNDLKIVNFENSFHLNKIKKKIELNNSYYTAPEQTSRINQNLNEKVDIYSLGIIFYELLSGNKPYEIDNLNTYDIVARELPSINELKKEIPNILSKVISKMINKNPEDRYDNILSLYLDIEKIKRELSNKNDIDFEIDTFKKNFLIKNENLFFGRDKEFSLFMKNFLTTNDNNQLHIVAGKSGVGKTTFVKKIINKYKEDFNFIDVKFDNYKQYIPHKVLINSFRKFCKEILVKDESELSFWKTKFLVSLGNDIQVLYNFIPELKTLIGEVNAISELDLVDSKIRFNNTLTKFLQLFSSKKEPLIIFLDDMQWADNITLEWLSIFLQRVSFTKVIISYRDNEVDKESILLKKISFFSYCKDLDVFEYKLNLLTQKDIELLINSNITLKDSEKLASVVFNKTEGNAFFIIQFLKDILDKKILFYDESEFIWNYNYDILKKLNVKSDIVEFLEKRINSLNNDQIRLLQIASCIGNTFSHEILKEIYNLDQIFDSCLEYCINHEWILETGLLDYKIYQFSHDKIQQVFYSLLTEQRMTNFHKLIGDYYFKRFNNKNDEYLLLCVNHYNKAKKYFDKESNIIELAKLNYKASLVARDNGDFQLSNEYIDNLFDFYIDIKKDEEYCEYLKDYAICKHLAYNKTKAIKSYKMALVYCKDDIKKAYIYEQLIKLYSDFSDFNDAYLTGKEALSLFNIFIPNGFNPIIFIKDFIELKIRLKNKNIHTLLNLKESTDEKIIISIKLLSSVLKAAYQIKPELCALISMKLVKICLRYGDTKDAVIGFMVFGVIFQGAILGNHKIGYDYAQLSLNMIKKYKNSVLEPEVKFVTGYFGLSWIESSIYTEQNWFESYNNGILNGDLFHSACAAAGIIQSMYMRGEKFDKIDNQITIFVKELSKRGESEQLDTILGIRQALKNLKGETLNVTTFDDDTFNEKQYVEKLSKFNSKHFAHMYYINKMISLYFYENYDLALEYLNTSKKYLSDSKGTLHYVEHFFYESLILEKSVYKADLRRKFLLIKKIKNNLKMFEKFAKNCPENFISKKNILSAIVAKLDKNYILSQKYFLKAIEVSKVYSQLNVQSISTKELYTLFIFLEQEKLANLYKDEYTKAFDEWKCEEKNEFEYKSLDISTLIKSTEIIFKEQKLSNLLKSLMKILLENSGAQNAFIILEEDFVYKVEAAAFNSDKNSINVLINKNYKEFDNIVQDIVKYVIRTKESIVINDYEKDPLFFGHKKGKREVLKSIISIPLVLQNSLKGIIYLENNLLPGIFTDEKIDFLKHLSSQITISVENAKIYKSLEQKVQKRTKDIDEKNEILLEQNTLLQKQNNQISELNRNLTKENQKRKLVEEKLQNAIKELDLLATTDSLTKLKNRRVFDQVLEKECSRVSRNKESFSLIMCDIDYFKDYNDFYGHLQGDECLKLVAKTLERNIKRNIDLIARYGGEEFAIIMPNTKKEEAYILANNIKKSLEKEKEPHEKSKISSFITLSMGVASSDEIEFLTPKNVVRFADNKLYEAKGNGRNQVR